MTLQDFIIKWQGRYCEVAGSPGATNQCVDLANAYIRDVLGLPIIEWTNAVDFPEKAGDKYEWIANTQYNIPKEGDIVVWKPSPGHIGVFIEGNVDKFKSLDQNFPVGSPCHVQDHTYQNVRGWLRVKTPPVDMGSEVDKIRLERDRNWNWFDAVCKALGVETNVDVAVAEAKKCKELSQTLIDKEKQLLEVQTQATDLQAQIELKTKAIEDVTAQVATLKIEVDKAQDQIAVLTKQTKEDQIALEDLKLAAQITKNLTGFRKWVFNTFIR